VELLTAADERSESSAGIVGSPPSRKCRQKNRIPGRLDKLSALQPSSSTGLDGKSAKLTESQDKFEKSFAGSIQ